ncbi:unnamed protein product [Rhizophagus irregularis]|nr:unnamed protein product [Rhizophagus irregularis]
MNIQLTTFSLIFSIVLYVSSRSWENFAAQFFQQFGDMGDVEYNEGVTDDGLDESSEDESDEDEDDLMINKLGLQTPIPVVETHPILPDVEMTPVDHTVISEKSQKKNKQKACTTVDKQVKNQSTTAKPDAKTSVKNS